MKLGTQLTFSNLEGAGIYHTATSCAYPCLGPTGSAFPLSDGRLVLAIGDVAGRGAGAATIMGQTRAALRALGELSVQGVPTTREAAIEILRTEEFASGRYSTSFLEESGRRLATVAMP